MNLLTALLFAAAPTTHDQLRTLFSDEWDWSEQASPENATENGDDRFDDKLTDWSLPAIIARHAHEKEALAKAEAFDKDHRAELNPDDQLDLNVYLFAMRTEVAGFPFPQELLQLNQLDSPPNALAELARAIPTYRVGDLERYLVRLKAVPAQVDQQIVLLRKAIELGVTAPKALLDDLPKLLEAHIPQDPAQSPLYVPVFDRLPDTISDADKARLSAAAKEVLAKEVFPAFQRLLDFAVKEYIPKARTPIAATALPNGAAWYAHDIVAQTSLQRSPDEIHALGLTEVARIEKEMDGLRAKVGFKGDRAAFFKFLNTDKRFFYDKPEQLLAGYRVIAKRIDPELPRHFKTLPRLTYGVEPMPAYEAKTAPGAFYEPGSPDVGRAGTFMANLYDLKSRPKWAMTDLTLHEAVPGHHLQIALAEELTDLPMFRRYIGYNSFAEGWALYAETLGDELGMLNDPYDKFGQLSAEMWRAVRLVVDTGLHAKGWTREQAVQYFMEKTGQPELNARVEVDRYLVWPAQACGYKLGQLTIKRLRADAEQALGEKFDEREFHEAVLGAGSLPLELLEARVKGWIKEQTAKAPQR